MASSLVLRFAKENKRFHQRSGRMVQMGKKTSHRSKHRARSHSESHAQGTITPVLEGNPLVPTGEARWIDTEKDFLQLCSELQETGIFAFDTEFIGEESYYPYTCLIQVATTDMVALIDPFAITDLTPLYSLITDPEVIVILHSASQDLDQVEKLMGTPPQTIFDTQLAAGLVGYPWPLSLTKSIEAILQHDVGGHFTFSQWDARPLSNRQKVYAADDVRYLLAVHDFFITKLEELDRTDWARNEFLKFSSKENYTFNLFNTVKRICKNKTPRKKEMQRIQALAKLREEIAIERNLPTRAIIPPECILALGKKPLETVAQLSGLRGFPKNIANKYGNQIITALANAEQHEPIQLRKSDPIEKDAIVRQELDGVWSLFNAWCIGNKLSPGLVTSRPIFTEWYLSVRKGDIIQDSPLLQGWRADVARQFSEMIVGNSSLSFGYNETLEARSDKP
jgi:ribonuclease D